MAKTQIGRVRLYLGSSLPHWAILLNGCLVGVLNLLVRVLIGDTPLEQATAASIAWGVGFGMGLWIGYKASIETLRWTKRCVSNQWQRVEHLLELLGIDSKSLPSSTESSRYQWWPRSWWAVYWSLSNLVSFVLVGLFLQLGGDSSGSSVSYGISWSAGMLISGSILFYGPIIRCEWRLRKLEERVFAAQDHYQQPGTRQLSVVGGIKALYRYIDRVTAWPVRLSLAARP